MKCPEDDHQMGLGDVFTLPAGDKAIVEADAVIDPSWIKMENLLKERARSHMTV